MADGKFSSYVYTVIDLAGINDDIKKKRIEQMVNLESWISESCKCFSMSNDFITTGSTSEGTVPFAASDSDCMIVPNDIICVDEANSDSNNILDILVADYENMPPGYVKVSHNNSRRLDHQNPLIATLFLPQSYWYGKPYISNQYFREAGKQSGKTIYKHFRDIRYNCNIQFNGPARTFQIDTNDMNFSSNLTLVESDEVHAIRFYNSSYLTQWSTRSRYHDWPSEELIHEVSTMEGFVLPVGEKESETQHLEWRISHVTAEKVLIKSLNSCQYKLYVILKLFSKHVFTSASKSFSSYMVKNVVLWMAENYPSHYFTPDLFIGQLLQSLNFIKQCLICSHLPSYMIPKKNLIAGRIVGLEKRELIKLLSSLTDEGVYVIYRLPKLAECLTYVSIHPEKFTKACIWRHSAETLGLSLHAILKYQCTDLKLYKLSLDQYYMHLLQTLNYRDQELLNVAFNLGILLLPDYLEPPFAPLDELVHIIKKRLNYVSKCFFL